LELAFRALFDWTLITIQAEEEDSNLNQNEFPLTVKTEPYL
jgi:hypothetical protein